MALEPAPLARLVPGSPAVAVAPARGPAAAQEPLAVAPMRAAPATASPARRSSQRSLENVTYSYFGPGVDRSNCEACIRSIAAFANYRDKSRGTADRARTRRWPISGDGRCARLQGDAGRIQIDRCAVGAPMRAQNNLLARQAT